MNLPWYTEKVYLANPKSRQKYPKKTQDVTLYHRSTATYYGGQGGTIARRKDMHRHLVPIDVHASRIIINIKNLCGSWVDNGAASSVDWIKK